MSPSPTMFSESGEEKLLTFLLEGREYGLRILEAREVVGTMRVEPVPKTPDFLLGVINLRGKIIPVVSLRRKFGLDEGAPSKENCIVVVDLDGTLTGLTVDSLVGVLTIEEDSFEVAPELGAKINTEFIAGIAKLAKRVVIVLRMDRILSNEELETVGETAIAMHG